jgi:hypothetical protein
LTVFIGWQQGVQQQSQQSQQLFFLQHFFLQHLLQQLYSHGTSWHSQWPRSTQRRQVVVTGTQETWVCMMVRSSTQGTQVQTVRVAVQTSGTHLQTV